MKPGIQIVNVVNGKHLVMLRNVSTLSLSRRYLLIILIRENKGRNQDTLYAVNIVMRHPKRVGFLNPAPDGFK